MDKIKFLVKKELHNEAITKVSKYILWNELQKTITVSGFYFENDKLSEIIPCEGCTIKDVKLNRLKRVIKRIDQTKNDSYWILGFNGIGSLVNSSVIATNIHLSSKDKIAIKNCLSSTKKKLLDLSLKNEIEAIKLLDSEFLESKDFQSSVEIFRYYTDLLNFVFDITGPYDKVVEGHFEIQWPILTVIIENLKVILKKVVESSYPVDLRKSIIDEVLSTYSEFFIKTI